MLPALPWLTRVTQRASGDGQVPAVDADPVLGGEPDVLVREAEPGRGRVVPPAREVDEAGLEEQEEPSQQTEDDDETQRPEAEPCRRQAISSSAPTALSMPSATSEIALPSM